MPDLPGFLLNELVNSVDKAIYNPKASVAQDNRDQPMLDFWKARSETVAMSQGVIRVNASLRPDLDSVDFQIWDGLDPLGAKEQEHTLPMEFGYYKIHSGILIRLAMLMDMGYNVDFNMKRGDPNSDFQPLSKGDAQRLRNWVKERLELAGAVRDTKLTHALLLDGATDSDYTTPGLDAIVSLTPTSGSYGGQPLTNPALQNGAQTGLTVTAAGTLPDAWNTLDWNASITNAPVGMKVDRFFCGRLFADGVKAYAKANGWSVNTNASGTGKLDISISDNGLVGVNGIKLEIVKEFDILDDLYAPSVAWSKRCYGVASKSMVLGCPFKKDWKMSAPPDSGTVRASMYSYDWQIAPFCKKKSANYVLAIA
jgi:hypothetical protein